MRSSSHLRSRSVRKVLKATITGPLFDVLESRTLMSVSGFVQPTFILAKASGSVVPAATSGPTGTTPATMRSAYAVDQAMFGSIVGNGAGQTIAIVDAYNEPSIAADLRAFDAQFGLAAPPSFTQVNETGGSALPSAGKRGGWGVESSLDVEWAHVIAPAAKIVLVEASSSYNSDMYAAVDEARNFPGVSVVSMSWGGNEVAGDTSTDSHFLTPANHIGVTFVASSGDDGAYSVSSSTKKIVEYPAASPNVLGVGGTTLTTSGGNYVSESGWGHSTSSYSQGGSGGGISKYTAQPSYQKGVVTQSSTFRTVPDVSLDADPNSGVPVYDVYDDSASNPWLQVGGTSLAAPMWSGVIAVADQGRVLSGQGMLNGRNDTLPDIYTLPSSDFHDVTAGNNGYAAGPGYDLVTGRGTPIVNLVVDDLVGVVKAGTPTIGSFNASPTSVTAGAPVTLTAGNVTETGGTGTITGVNFYIETGSGHTMLGPGQQVGNAWTFNIDTTNFAPGTYTYDAIATDSSSNTSATATTSFQVTSGTGATPITGTVLAWNVDGQSGYGVQGLHAGTVATGATNSTGLTRGPGLATNNNFVANAWGANKWAASSSTGISNGQYVTFGFAISSGYSTSLSSIAMNYRRSLYGPSSGYWQYSVNGGAWGLIGNFANEFSVSKAAGAAITPISLSGVPALQNLAAGSVVNFRVLPYGASTTGGTWYVYDGGKNTDDLVISAAGSAQSPGAAKTPAADPVSNNWNILVGAATPAASTFGSNSFQLPGSLDDQNGSILDYCNPDL